LGRLARARFRRAVTKALALAPRGFVWRDVLHLSGLSARLQVEWRTRDIHPWDRDMPPGRRGELFRDQAVRDTEAAILRLFDLLPDIDAIDVRVLEPHAPNRLILAGTVVRADALAAQALSSPAMRLAMMGVRCRTTDGRLEPLDTAGDAATRRSLAR